MATQRESICCKEIEQINSLLEGDGLAVRPVCISEHADFSNVCLCRAVLMGTLHSHRYHYGSADEPVDENRCLWSFNLPVLCDVGIFSENFDTWRTDR